MVQPRLTTLSPHRPAPARLAWARAVGGWLVTAAVLAAAYWMLARPDVQLGATVRTHGSPRARTVALTFDDGPHPLWAPLLAETLERHGARGTFFLVGMEAQRYPEITARLARGGHEIAAHSMTHPYPNLTALPGADMGREVRDSRALLAQLADAPVTAFRPPGGGVNTTLLRQLRQQQLMLAWWSINAVDAYPRPPEAIAGRLRQHLRPGQVVLLHERAYTAAALERFFADTPGTYRYITFSEMMNAPVDAAPRRGER